jgi:hypothetical protein
MRYVCDAPDGKTWFGMDSEAEAAAESDIMRHAVEKFFRVEKEKAVRTYRSPLTNFIEQEIGLNAHVRREMPLFLTLRDGEGTALATAMLPPAGQGIRAFRPMIVGFENSDPYPAHGDAIKALGKHFGMPLERELCYPYTRR